MTESSKPQRKLATDIAEEVRALLARRRVTSVALARSIGKSHTYVWRRLNGETAFDLNDLEQIAETLGVSPLDLFSAAAGATTLRYSQAHIPSPRKPRESRPAGRSDSRAPRDGRPRRIGQTYAASRVAG